MGVSNLAQQLDPPDSKSLQREDVFAPLQTCFGESLFCIGSGFAFTHYLSVIDRLVNQSPARYALKVLPSPNTFSGLFLRLSSKIH